MLPVARAKAGLVVANAGALGAVSTFGSDYTPEVVAEELDFAAERTDGALGANFLMVAVDPGRAGDFVAAAASRVRVMDFFWGEPDASLVRVAHDGGALASWQVGSREEAMAAADAGCDFVIAQSIEAGGHVRGRIGLLSLLDQVLGAVDVPVLAAGGVGSGRALAAVLKAGADGARVGTRFLAAPEANTHPVYLQALVAAEAEDTVYTEAFSVGWPNAPHRVLRSCLEAAEAHPEEIVGEYVRVATGARWPLRRFESCDIHDGLTGAIEAMPHWAGESVSHVTGVQSAAEIVDELVGKAERLL